MNYYIHRHTKQGIETISGMGRNKGTWDTEAKSLSTARRWLRELKTEHPKQKFTIGTLSTDDINL